MALIELIDISKSFDKELVLDEFDLSIKENEFITLLGPSRKDYYAENFRRI